MIEIEVIVMLSVLAAVFVIGVACAMRPLRRVGRFAVKSDAAKSAPAPLPVEVPQKSSDDCYVLEEEVERLSEMQAPAGPAKAKLGAEYLPSLTVVVYALSNEERLQEYLRDLMRQDYPDFEVVVVFDGGVDRASDMADIFMSRYPNLRLTFIPPGSHNLSRRKLAWTLGMKSADKDVVLTTGANSRIPSRDWLYEMMAPFADPAVQLVLGLTRFDFAELQGAGRWYHQFDRVMSNSAWIARAVSGTPYRGDCYNMAFRRQLFFDHNGYAQSIGKPFGDDDIFVTQIATAANTRVVISPETILTMDWGISTERVRVSLKEQQMFAERFLPKGPFLRQGLLSTCTWLMLLLTAAVIVISLLTMLPAVPWPAIAAFVLLLAYFGCMIAFYRKAATALQAVRLWWSVPVFMLWRPIDNLLFRIIHRKAKVMDFIWNGYQ